MGERLTPAELGTPVERATKRYDASYRYRGYYDREPGGICRVRIYSSPIQEPPVMVITDPPDNASTSVTNMIEILVPELIRDLMPHRFEEPIPVSVIEHLPAMVPVRGRGLQEYRREDEYSGVSFESWRPRKIWLGGQERLSLGDPGWFHLPHSEVARYIGEEALRDTVCPS